MTDRFEHITSPANSRLRNLRRWQGRAQRERDNVIVLEGEDLVCAALDAGCGLRWVIADDARVGDIEALIARAANTSVAVAPAELVASVSELAHPPRVIAIADRPAWASCVPEGMARVVLDGVHDPGNLGTLVRSAAAFGVAVVLLPGCADPWSGKALRAAMGATFRCTLVRAASCADACVGVSTVIGLDANASGDLWSLDLGRSPAMVVGSERSGLSSGAHDCVNQTAAIPFQDPDSDSLNAGVAGSLAIYEWARQSAVRHEVVAATEGVNDA